MTMRNKTSFQIYRRYSSTDTNIYYEWVYYHDDKVIAQSVRLNSKEEARESIEKMKNCQNEIVEGPDE